MLLEFSVENFLSIKNEITLSMIATNDKSLSYNIIKFNKINLLKSVAIYGPNASGKTNILNALYRITYLIVNSQSTKQGEALDFRPFKLDSQYENMPSRFKITFEINNIKYIYELSFDKNKIHLERLWYYPHGRRRLVFSRDIKDPKVYYFPKEDEKFQNEIKDHTLDNMLYLSRSANMKYDKTSIVVDWFTKNLDTIFPENYLITDTYSKKMLAKNDITKEGIIRFTSKADNKIVGIEVRERDVGDDFLGEILKNLPQEIKDEIIEDARIDVETIHNVLDNNGNKIEVRFRMAQEAKGTRKMFNLAAPFFNALSGGRLLVIDEIETSLHPVLVRNIIELFNNPKYNKSGAQLIFTTHNTNLMHPIILRRDQIWLTEKGNDQSTNFLSLCEYKVRPDENIEKGYLLGRYGAIPDLD